MTVASAAYARLRADLAGTSIDIDAINADLHLTPSSAEWTIAVLAAVGTAPARADIARLNGVLSRVEVLLDRAGTNVDIGRSQIEAATKSACERILTASLARPWHYIVIFLLIIIAAWGILK
ncbi:MAG TPA: hypothetical protein VIJ12_02505 [Candidatus Baltobacteraceae bacterium]